MYPQATYSVHLPTGYVCVCVCVCVHVHTYTYICKISWDDGHRMRDASANMRDWIPGIRDKGRTNRREQELRQEGSEPPWHDQAHQHQSHTPEQSWENRKPEL